MTQPFERDCEVCGSTIVSRAYWSEEYDCCCECDPENRKNIEGDYMMDLEREA